MFVFEICFLMNDAFRRVWNSCQQGLILDLGQQGHHTVETGNVWIKEKKVRQWDYIENPMG
jgi:hypothetical protein